MRSNQLGGSGMREALIEAPPPCQPCPPLQCLAGSFCDDCQMNGTVPVCLQCSKGFKPDKLEGCIFDTANSDVRVGCSNELSVHSHARGGTLLVAVHSNRSRPAVCPSLQCVDSYGWVGKKCVRVSIILAAHSFKCPDTGAAVAANPCTLCLRNY